MEISITDAAYAAGLFDGEGSVYFKKTKQKKHQRPGKPIHNVTVIRMEIAMTDKDTIKWCHDLFKCGAFGERKVKPGYKRQWRWRVPIEMLCMLLKFFGPTHKLNYTRLNKL